MNKTEIWNEINFEHFTQYLWSYFRKNSIDVDVDIGYRVYISDLNSNKKKIITYLQNLNIFDSISILRNEKEVFQIVCKIKDVIMYRINDDKYYYQFEIEKLTKKQFKEIKIYNNICDYCGNLFKTKIKDFQTCSKCLMELIK